MINQTCPLIVRDLYSYDVVSAYPTILNQQFYNFQDINLDDKEARSIFLGKKQIGNSNLSEFLMESIDNIVKFYLLENSVSDSEIIVTQRDGFIIKKMLNNNDQFIEMKFREYIDILILSIDRKKYLYLSDDKVTVKGMPHFYPELNKIYQLFSNLNFYDKSILFGQLDNIKQSILKSDNKMLFMIPKDEDHYIVSTYTGDIIIKDPDMISLNKINKVKYFQHFIKDFLNSIFIECY